MAITYAIDKERRLITSTLKGFLSLETLVAYRNQLIADPDFNPRFDVLIDFRQVTCYELTPQEIQAFVGKPAVSPARRRAFVVRNKAKLNPLLKYCCSLPGLNAALFEGTAEAKKWLSMPDHSRQW